MAEICDLWAILAGIFDVFQFSVPFVVMRTDNFGEIL